MMDAIAIHRLAETLATGGGACVSTWPHVAEPRERELAAAFAAGDAVAAQQVVDVHQDAIAKLVDRMLGWPGDDRVNDIVQDVFVRALVSRDRFNRKATLKTWLTRIAINECRGHLRKSKRREMLLRMWRAGLQARHESPPEQQKEQREQAAEVRQAIAALSVNYREVIVLYYLEEMPASEIAQTLGLKPGAVATRLSRARDKLRQSLESITS